MKTEFLMEYTATLKEGLPIGSGPVGERVIVDVTGGSFEGPKARGKILHSGGDWLLVRPSGFAQLDVRATFATDDGANLYVQYYGIVEMTEAAQAALAGGGETQFGDGYFFTQLRFETGTLLRYRTEEGGVVVEDVQPYGYRFVP